MLGSNHFVRDDREFSNSARRPECPGFKTFANHDSNSHSNSRENETRANDGNSLNLEDVGFNSEINRLSGELIQRTTQEMNGLMKRVNLKNQ